MATSKTTTRKASRGRRRTTTDAVEIIDRLFFEGNPEAQAILEEERANGDVARMIYDLRTEAGLSQRALAKLVGTSASVICDLEDADYHGHSLSLLRRIAAAVGKRVETRFVSARPRRAPTKPRRVAKAANR